MSSSESTSDSETSYQSNDSDINFIPGYVIIEDAGINNDGNVLHEDSENFNAGAYAEEPLADEAWLQNYNRKEQERLELEEKLKRRINGSVEISEWIRCKCGNCGTNRLSNSYECLCCCELEGCEDALKKKEVLEDLKAEGILDVKCITQHPGFSQVCLQKWSLKFASDRYKTKSKSRYCQEGTENRFLRSVSYQEFTRLVYGVIGNRRIPLPSCAYMAIRKVFLVDKKENYTGYVDEPDSE